MATDAKSTGSTKVDAIVQNVKAAEPAQLSGLALYSRFALAGAVCCSVTHGGLTPVDVYVPPVSDELDPAGRIGTVSLAGILASLRPALS